MFSFNTCYKVKYELGVRTFKNLEQIKLCFYIEKIKYICIMFIIQM